MRTHPWLPCSLLTVLGTTLLLAGDARADNEVTVYGIANFGDYWNCGTSDMTHSVHTDTANAFKGTFDFWKSLLLWDVTRSANNPYAKGTLWTDPSQSLPCSGCSADDATASGADAADVVYMHTHGGHTSTLSSFVMGSASYGCSVNTKDNMLFNTDLEVAVIKACQSGDYNTWANGSYFQLVTGSSQFSLWNAFHGDSSCGGFVTDYVSDYTAESLADGMGENWIDEAYSNPLFGSDDCPVSIVFGSTSANRENQYRYGGFIDRKSTGTKSGSTIYFISGCDPDSGTKLP